MYRSGKSVYAVLCAAATPNSLLAVRTEASRQRAIDICMKYKVEVPNIFVAETKTWYEKEAIMNTDRLTKHASMKAIPDLTNEEYQLASETFFNLRHIVETAPKSEFFTYTREGGYAHYKFTGLYTGKLRSLLGRHPTPEEIIMLVDNGFSHFGAHCTVDFAAQTFYGRVNTD